MHNVLTKNEFYRRKLKYRKQFYLLSAHKFRCKLEKPKLDFAGQEELIRTNLF